MSFIDIVATQSLTMKGLSIVLLLIMFSCGGSLSDEQRKQMREKMEENKIVHVTEVEITEAAFAQGRSAVKTLDSLGADSAAVEAFIGNYEGEIHFVQPGDETIRLLEQQLIDAYLGDPSGSFQDNVQAVRNDQGDTDSLLYSKPVMRKLPDGQDALIGVWNIWLSRKELVKDIGRTK